MGKARRKFDINEYDFYVTIYVRNPYFDDISFRLNPSTVSVEERKAGNATTIRLGSAALNFGDKFDPKQSVEYCQYKEMGEEIKAALMQARQQAREEKAAAEAPKVAVMCPFCGAQTIPDAKGCCEYCGGALGK